jgi:hypothetical protein
MPKSTLYYFDLRALEVRDRRQSALQFALGACVVAVVVLALNFARG